MRGRIASALLSSVVLCSRAGAATDQWIEVQSAHFTVVSDARERDARQILDQFERMRWVFGALFPKASSDPAQPVVVVAAKNSKTFASMEPADYLGRGKLKLGGYFLHTLEKNYILLRLDAEYEHPYATVYHEYTHLQFTWASEWMPLWLNEGLAAFMQNTVIRNKDVILGEPSAEDVMYLRTHAMIPLSILFKVDAASAYYHEENKGSVFYAESWALTHFLMMTDRANHTERLNHYIESVSRNEDPLMAAEKSFGDLGVLQKALDVYVHAGNYRMFAMSSAAAPIDESKYKVRALTSTEAEALRADVLVRVQRTTEARALLAEVLKEDPENVQAHETMGYLAVQEKDYAEARKWYAEAVKLDSRDYLAQYYFAALSLNAMAPGEDKEIESSLRSAIRLNPRFAPAYDALAAFYDVRHENLEEAHWLSLRAISLDMGNAGYRVNAASVLASLGRYEDALTALRGAGKVATNQGEVAMVRSQVERVHRMEEARAQAEEDAKERQEATPARASVAEVSTGPTHPTELADGPRHVVAGIIANLRCNYPTEIEFQIRTEDGKSMTLYNNDYDKIDFTAVGFIPKVSMNPCTDFKGMKIRATYVETPDKTVDGQIVAMVLTKAGNRE
jgi:tetratricopeptide (TPR) repeat protein